MDKIWDRKSFEVKGHWPLWRGWKLEWPCRTDKSRTLKKERPLYQIGYKSIWLFSCHVKSTQFHLHLLENVSETFVMWVVRLWCDWANWTCTIPIYLPIMSNPCWGPRHMRVKLPKVLHTGKHMHINKYCQITCYML